MRVYQVRDKEGVLKAILNEENARSIFQNLNGKWETNKVGKRMFVLTEDGKITAPLHTIILYVWAGDVLIESIVDC